MRAASMLLDAAKQLLVLELLVAEADQRLERHLIAEQVLPTELEHLRVDEALDEAEDVRVGAALNLAQQPSLGRAQELEVVDLGQAVRQERPRVVESRPRITSASMSQRTCLDTLMVRA